MNEKISQKSWFKYVVIAGILIIPFLYAFFYLKAYWDPYGHMQDIPVAIVNNDEGDEGSTLVTSLKDKNVLDLHEVSSSKAKDGLKNKKYYATITIPKNFTKDLNSAKENKKVKAEIVYSPNQKSNYLASQIIDRVVVEVEKQVRSEVSNEVVKTLSGKIDDAIDQVSQIDEGVDALKAGSSELTDGANTLANGTVTLSNGANSLASGAYQLKNGVYSLKNGTKSAKDGADTIKNKVAESVASLANDKSSALDENTLNQIVELSKNGATLTDDQLNAIANQASKGATLSDEDLGKIKAAAANEVKSQAETIKKLADEGIDVKADEIKSGADDQIDTLLTLLSNNGIGFYISAQSNGQTVTVPLTEEQQKAIVAEMKKAAEKSALASAKQIAEETALTTATNTAQTTAESTAKTVASLVANGVSRQVAQQVATQTAEGVASSVAPSVANQVKQVATQRTISSMNTLTDGLGQLSDGLGTLDNGASELVDGANSLSNGANTLVSGANQLNSGANTLSNGMNTLNTGINTLGTKVADGLYSSKQELTKLNGLDKFTANPVKTVEKDVNKVSTYGSAFAPFFLSIGLWVGALVAFVMLYNDPDKKFKIFSIDTDNKPLRTLAYMGLSACQAIVLGILLLIFLDLDITSYPLYFGALILVALMFESIIEFCIVNFGDAGKFIVMIILVLQLAASGGTFPIQTVDKGFQKFYNYLPMKYSIDLFREVVVSIDGNLLRQVLGVIIGITLVFTILNVIRDVVKKTAD